MSDLDELGAFYTQQAVNEVAEILRANGIQCTVETRPDSGVGSLVAGAYTRHGRPPSHSVFVAAEDKRRAEQALQGALACEWFLCTPQGHRYHAFETATSEMLRDYVKAHQQDDHGRGYPDARYIADLLDQNRWRTVYQAFHEGHFWNRQERLIDGRSLADWARSCGCSHAHHPTNE